MHLNVNRARIVCLILALCSLSDISAADDKKFPETELSIKRVVMYSSGVGFFERTGKVKDDATIELRFGSRDINDLLKSLVLEDLDGGQVTTVSYSARNPASQALKTFSIDLTVSPTLADLLRQVRGERVRISVPEPVEGKLLGVEQHKQLGERGAVITWEVVNLLTEGGLRAVRLENAVDVRLLDEKLNAELDEALTLIAQARGTDKKSVTLRCSGKGERNLRVGYIQETPVWKTSYRLILRDDEKPFLQGWAIVENTSDHDWNDVQLNLVSGRPVSFIMDLYQPMFAVRPTVRPELFAGLRPQRHGQDLLPSETRVVRGGFGGGGGAMGGGGGGGFGGGGFGSGMGGGLGGAVAPATSTSGDAANKSRYAGVGETAPSAAKSDEVGELFRYAISAPVTISRQQSAMLPIVNESVAGKKVGIFNPATDARHPLTAFQLENSTKLHLMQGPISVFDDGEYAGDSQMADLAPGAKRLVSYALDLNCEIVADPKNTMQRLIAITIVDGVLHTTELSERTTKYRLKNSDEQAKEILIEQALEAPWKLASPKEPAEKTRSLYRFAVKLDGGESQELPVVEQREETRKIALGGLSEEHLAVYLRGDVAGGKLKPALTSLRKLRGEVAQCASATADVRQQLAEIATEQDRIRSNMNSLDKSSDLYKRYVKKFGEQEDTVEKLRGKLPSLREAEAAASKSLADYLATLTVK